MTTELKNKIVQQLLEKFSLSEAKYVLRCLTEDMNQSDSTDDKIAEAVNEILKGKPLQYVTGVAWFYKMKFTVNEHVLIPRPETEELVEWILENFDEQPIRVLDIGTGSGCIAVALKRMRIGWNVEACDISREVIAVAKENARSNNVDVKFFEMDIGKPDVLSQYDLVVSNPPYITRTEANTLHQNVVNHEPHLALFAPSNDPLFFYKAIADFASEHLSTIGSVFVEINQNLSEETFNHFVPYFRYLEMRKDISGNFRMLYANGLKNHPPSR